MVLFPVSTVIEATDPGFTNIDAMVKFGVSSSHTLVTMVVVLITFNKIN